MAHNLVRAAGALASLPFAKARAATIRRDLIAVAARTARRSGLTSPEPVRTPTAPGHPDPLPEPGTQDKPHSRLRARIRWEWWCRSGRLVEPPAFGLPALVMVSA
jgi:hypothetical protein